MKKIFGLFGMLLISSAALAQQLPSTVPMKCAKTPPAGYLKALANAISTKTLNSFTLDGFTDIRVRVGFKSRLRDTDPVDVYADDVLQGIDVSPDSSEAPGTVQVFGSKGSFADDCRYEIDVTVGFAGKNPDGEKVVKRTLSTIDITAPRVANNRR